MNTVTKCEVDDLQVFTTYNITLRASNGLGWSEDSDPIQVHTNAVIVLLNKCFNEKKKKKEEEDITMTTCS